MQEDDPQSDLYLMYGLEYVLRKSVSERPESQMKEEQTYWYSPGSPRIWRCWCGSLSTRAVAETFEPAPSSKNSLSRTSVIGTAQFADPVKGLNDQREAHGHSVPPR